MAEPGVILVWSGSRGLSRTFRVPADGLVLGRELLPELTDDDRISRSHARISHGDGRLLVGDLGSRNGTFVDGHAVPTATPVRGTVVRTGRTIWVIVDDLERSDVAAQARTVAEVARAAAPEIVIHATLIEQYLLLPDRTSIHDNVTRAACVRARTGGDLRGEHLDLPIAGPSNPAVYAVFPGLRSARAAARRLAAKLPTATASEIVDGRSTVDVRRDARRVTIACPPSTAYEVTLFDGGTVVATGFTLEDEIALELATAWLDGAPLGVVTAAHAFMKPPS